MFIIQTLTDLTKFIENESVKESESRQPELTEIFSDSKGPFKLFIEKSILEGIDKSNYSLGNKSKNKKHVLAQDERKSGRISKQPRRGNN